MFKAPAGAWEFVMDGAFTWEFDYRSQGGVRAFSVLTIRTLAAESQARLRAFMPRSMDGWESRQGTSYPALIRHGKPST